LRGLNNKKIGQHRQSNQVTQTTALQQSVDSVTDLRVLAQVLFKIQNVPTTKIREL